MELAGRGALQTAVGREGGGLMLFDLVAGRTTGKARRLLPWGGCAST